MQILLWLIWNLSILVENMFPPAHIIFKNIPTEGGGSVRHVSVQIGNLPFL